MSLMWLCTSFSRCSSILDSLMCCEERRGENQNVECDDDEWHSTSTMCSAMSLRLLSRCRHVCFMSSVTHVRDIARAMSVSEPSTSLSHHHHHRITVVITTIIIISMIRSSIDKCCCEWDIIPPCQRLIIIFINTIIVSVARTK